MSPEEFPVLDQDQQGIFFHSEDRELPDCIHKKSALIKRWMKRIADKHSHTVGSIHIHFCSDEVLLQMNRSFLNHDYFTDILTFPDSDALDNTLSGDLYISLDRLEENAENHGEEFCDECLRVIIHGLLHLSGQGDRSGEEQTQMRRLEDEALNLYYHLDEDS